MNVLTETLLDRVDRLIEARKQPVRSTSPSSVVIAELAARVEALEQALREVAGEVQRANS